MEKKNLHCGLPLRVEGLFLQQLELSQLTWLLHSPEEERERMKVLRIRF